MEAITNAKMKIFTVSKIIHNSEAPSMEECVNNFIEDKILVDMKIISDDRAIQIIIIYKEI